MMRIAVIVVTLGVLANSQSPCCLSSYEGTWSWGSESTNLLTGEWSAARGFNRISADVSDRNNVRFRGDRTFRNIYTGELLHNTELVVDGIEYIFNETHCDSQAFQLEFNGCIPDSAEFRGTNVLGLGEHSLTIHAWSFRRGNLTAIMRVTDQCVPVSYDAFGVTNNVDFAEANYLVGYTAGFQDPSKFDIPAYCAPNV